MFLANIFSFFFWLQSFQIFFAVDPDPFLSFFLFYPSDKTKKKRVNFYVRAFVALEQESIGVDQRNGVRPDLVCLYIYIYIYIYRCHKNILEKKKNFQSDYKLD